MSSAWSISAHRRLAVAVAAAALILTSPMALPGVATSQAQTGPEQSDRAAQRPTRQSPAQSRGTEKRVSQRTASRKKARRKPTKRKRATRKRRKKRKKKLRNTSSCLRTLKRLGVRYKSAKRRGIAIGVRVIGDIGGVTYQGYRKKPLILDCSLVASLAEMGPHLTAKGIERAIYSSSYQRRRVRGSKRWSKHSYGLAIDVHEFVGERLGKLRVKDDYEQGLGDNVDCIGRPLTLGGGILRTLYCQFEHSGMFHSILTPDYDAGHYNHYHIEADPWTEREIVPERRPSSAR